MAYDVELSRQARDFLKKLDASVRERIRKRLRRLEEDPVPSDAKFIGRHQGEKVFRYRIGGYRALYKVKKQTVLVARIEKRPRAYD